MGSSLVQCLANHGYGINVSNPSTFKLDQLKERFPSISVTSDNAEACKGADVIFLAVKPYLIGQVLNELVPSIDPSQIIVSLASGIGTEKLASLTETLGSPVFYIIPNTALSKGKSMTFYCCARADEYQEKMVKSLLDVMGQYMKVNEEKMGAFTSLSSCGIAYALRYIRAEMEGAVEIGIKPDVAQAVICQTLKGAVALLEDGAHPEAEIDKVTTPGGLTIKGLNAMESNGFTASVIEGLKASMKF